MNTLNKKCSLAAFLIIPPKNEQGELTKAAFRIILPLLRDYRIFLIYFFK